MIVVQRRFSEIKGNNAREFRAITEICEVRENGELNPLFKFNFKKKRLEKCGELQELKEKLENTFGFDKKGLGKELRKRENFMEESKK